MDRNHDIGFAGGIDHCLDRCDRFDRFSRKPLEPAKPACGKPAGRDHMLFRVRMTFGIEARRQMHESAITSDRDRCCSGAIKCRTASIMVNEDQAHRQILLMLWRQTISRLRSIEPRAR